MLFAKHIHFLKEKKKKKTVQKLTANIMHKEKAEKFLAKCLWSKWWASS